MVKCGIYAIYSPSGKAYIGSSRRLRFRRTRHFYELKQGLHHCTHLQHAWNKYGDMMKYVVLEQCVETDLIIREQWWIDNYALMWAGIYNSRLVVDPTAPLSEETKAKVSAALKGRVFSQEHKQNMRKPKSPEHAAAISAGKMGKSYGSWTAERREIMMAAQKPYTDEQRAKRSAVIKAGWGDERRRKQTEAFARRKINLEAQKVRQHVEMLNWIVQSDPRSRIVDLFSHLPVHPDNATLPA